ncbi:MAG TPA: VOC family protein, partial [Thermoplasmata archaeon]
SHRRIELNWYPKGSLFYRRYAPGDALDHLDFTVGVCSRERFETTYRRLLAGGGRPSGYTPSNTGGWMFSVLDPDGVWITVGRRPTPAERRAMK